jgi:hypothetical protein
VRLSVLRYPPGCERRGLCGRPDIHLPHCRVEQGEAVGWKRMLFVCIVHFPHLGVSGSEVGDLIQSHQAQRKDSDGFCHDLGIGLNGPEMSNVRNDVTKNRLALLEIQYEAHSLGSGLRVPFDMVNQNYGLRPILLLEYFTTLRGVQTERHNNLQFQHTVDGYSMCWPHSYHEHDLRCLRSPVPLHTNRVESHALN